MNLSRNSIVELRDGTRALIRPIGPLDRKRLNEGFESANCGVDLHALPRSPATAFEQRA